MTTCFVYSKIETEFQFIFYAEFLFAMGGPFILAGIYRTKQRELILDFLRENSNLHFTADDIANHFANKGIRIGRATVYRYLGLLVESNMVRKYPLGNGASACYQFINDTSQCSNHYHLKCNGCSKLIHMECSDLDKLFHHLEDKHGFRADATQTIVYGNCAECAKNN